MEKEILDISFAASEEAATHYTDGASDTHSTDADVDQQTPDVLACGNTEYAPAATVEQLSYGYSEAVLQSSVPSKELESSNIPDSRPGKKKKPAKKSRGKKAIRVMKANPYEFVLVGDKYYRHARVPLPGGGYKEVMLRVSRAQIEEDFPSRDERDLIPRCISFTTLPDNIHYERFVDGFYNRYSPPVITPAEGPWLNIEAFLQHIFGDQYLLALDYFKLLYVMPVQRLPVMVLVSQERGTGKTTLLNLLSAWFGSNMAFATNEAFKSRFNSDWAGKLVVAVDETLLNRRVDGEKIKAMATSQTVSLEAKGCDRIEVPNFTHFVMATNNIHDPIIIDKEENRYWIIDVHAPEHDDPLLLDKLKRELPAFSWYLIHRHKLTFTEPKSRLWFPPEAYATLALQRIQSSSSPTEQQQLAEFLTNVMDELSIDEFSATLTDLQQLLKERGFRFIRLKKVLRSWPAGRIEHATDNLTYDSFVDGGKLTKKPIRKTGRFYTFVYKELEEIA